MQGWVDLIGWLHTEMVHSSRHEMREAKGKDKGRYHELKAEVQRKLREDKQQQLEGRCVELEAAISKENSSG